MKCFVICVGVRIDGRSIVIPTKAEELAWDGIQFMVIINKCLVFKDIVTYVYFKRSNA